MKLGRTLTLIVLFSAVIFVYLSQKRVDKDIASIVPDEVSRGFSLEPDEKIVRITILDHARKAKTSLELSKKGWMLTAPVLYPADPRSADGLAATLRFVSKQTRLRGEKDWNEYGLEKPQFEVAIETDKKKKETLAFGNPAPVGKAVYAYWESERGYILLPPEVKNVFEASVYTLREKRLFRMLPEAVRKVSIELGSHTYQWKKDGEKWYWFEPLSKFGQELPKDRAEAVLGALFGLFIKEFLDDNKKPAAELGFFVIHDKIKLEGKPGDKEAFYFGNEVPAANAYYGMKDKEKTVFLIDRAKIFQLLDLLRAVENEKDAQDKVPSKVMTQASGTGLS